MSKDEPLLSNCPLETAEPSRNYARVPGHKKKYKKKGRVRSIVNYDKTYGIFLRGFANFCAVSNSVSYDRALLW